MDWGPCSSPIYFWRNIRIDVFMVVYCISTWGLSNDKKKGNQPLTPWEIPWDGGVQGEVQLLMPLYVGEMGF